MKTTIDIPDRLLSDAIRFTKAKTKKEAILTALEDYNRRKAVEEVTASFGTWDIASNDEIESADIDELQRPGK